jgi:hypothetical protein
LKSGFKCYILSCHILYYKVKIMEGSQWTFESTLFPNAGVAVVYGAVTSSGVWSRHCEIHLCSLH